MMHPRRLCLLVAVTLFISSCGDDATGDSTTTAPGETTTTTATGTTGSTIPTDSSPLAGMVASGVQNPFSETGFHAVHYGDDSRTWVVSDDSITGAAPGVDVLAVGLLTNPPTITGLPEDLVLTVAWIHNYQGEVVPGAYVLYAPSDAGWEVLGALRESVVLDYLAMTTDYQAKAPAGGQPYAATTLKTLVWDGAAHITADTEVRDHAAGDAVVFTGSIACTITNPGGCILTSDDGVLRPGDVDDAVQALEEDLSSIGYFGATPDTVYDAITVEWVTRFQRDYRLTADGKVGPQTFALIEDLVSGTSAIVMAHQEGVQGVSFGTTVESALPALIGLLGSPDYTLGWEMGACGPTPPYGGWEWYKVTWGGFTAWFTEKSGSRQFDGWQVTDLDDVPTNLYFVGGVGPGWNWGQMKALGAVYDDFYGWWNLVALDYRLGGLVAPYGNPPANSTKIEGWGVGTAGVLYDC